MDEEGNATGGDGGGTGEGGRGGGRQKFYFDGDRVEIDTHLVYELDADGRQLRCVKFTDYATEKVRMPYASTDDLQSKWSDPEQRRAIVNALQEHSIDFDQLATDRDRPDADPFDLFCHLAYDAPLSTRQERAERLRREQSDFFDRYDPRGASSPARQVRAARHRRVRPPGRAARAAAQHVRQRHGDRRLVWWCRPTTWSCYREAESALLRIKVIAMITRILLDTCTVRSHIHGTTPLLDLEAIKAWRHKYRVSLADSTMAELLSQLVEERLPMSLWTSRVGDFDHVLDQQWPVFPGGCELASIAETSAVHGHNLRDSKLYYQAGWRLLRTAQNIRDLQQGITYSDSSSKQFAIRADAKHIASTMRNARNEWIDYISRMKTQLASQRTGRKNVETIVGLMKSDLGSRPDDPPDLAEKLDGLTRMIAQFVDMALHSASPYNPKAERRRGDVFDLSLLFSLPLPAVICTGDGSFVNRLRATGARQSAQVVTIDEFNSHARLDTLESILGSHYEEQGRRWRDAAYLRWCGRGRPPIDDWADWFAVEPIT